MNDIVERLRQASSSPGRNSLGFGNHWNLEDEAADTIEALRRERDELKEDNERLGKGIDDITFRHSGGLRAYEKLIESQARAAQLREALLDCDAAIAQGRGIPASLPITLALPQDDTALKQWGAKLLRDVGCKAFLQPLDFDVYLNRMAEEMTK